MITIADEKLNPISQDFYNSIVFSIEPATLTCSCGHSGCLIWYGSYKRSVRLPDRILSLHISRVLCNHCGCTHAILPASLVPYSQFPLALHAAVAACCGQESNPQALLDSQLFADENNIASIRRSYLRHWRERLLCAAVPLFPLTELIHYCFSAFSRQFMQVKTTPNKLFCIPT